MAGETPPLDKMERLRIFYEWLREQPPVPNADAAFDLVKRTLTQVEDAYSGVTENPNPTLTTNDGRMYPPQKDMTDELEGGGLRAKTKGNIIDFRSDGTIDFYNRKTFDPAKDNTAIFTKAGQTLEALNTLDQDLQKTHDVATTGVISPTAKAPAAESTTPAVHPTPERDDRTPSK